MKKKPILPAMRADALRSLLTQVDQFDKAVFEAPMSEALAIKLRRHLESMGDLITGELSLMEQTMAAERSAAMAADVRGPKA